MSTSKMVFPELLIDSSDINLWLICVFIAFNPIYWNVVARWEYRTHTLSDIFMSPRVACFIFGITILLLGVFRDWQFLIALNSQPRWLLLQTNYILWTGHLLVLFGVILVASSFFALGFFGTFLGDYFGILLPSKVNCFPFNVFNHPMYLGSTMNFLGTSLIQASQAGILITLLVAGVYVVAISYEGPFTESIYVDAAERRMKRDS